MVLIPNLERLRTSEPSFGLRSDSGAVPGWQGDRLNVVNECKGSEPGTSVHRGTDGIQRAYSDNIPDQTYIENNCVIYPVVGLL
jgi:hypothetical protein